MLDMLPEVLLDIFNRWDPIDGPYKGNSNYTYLDAEEGELVVLLRSVEDRAKMGHDLPMHLQRHGVLDDMQFLYEGRNLLGPQVHPETPVNHIPRHEPLYLRPDSGRFTDAA